MQDGMSSDEAIAAILIMKEPAEDIAWLIKRVKGKKLLDIQCENIHNVLMKSKKRTKLIEDVIHLVAGYFNLDVDVEIEVGRLGEHNAEVGQESIGFYSIEFDKKFLTTASKEDIICVTSHEMVHVKQYEQDSLDLSDEGNFYKGHKWKGEYWFSPWECEARGYEQAFLQHYLHYGKNQKKAIAAKPKKILDN